MTDTSTVVGYRTLVAAVERVTAVWGHGPVRCAPLPSASNGGRYGDAKGRTVRFARSAPLWVVAHELAHVLTPGDRSHGAAWQAQAVSLERLL